MGCAPALYDFRVRIELRDLHPTHFDLLASCRNAVKRAILGASNGVGKTYIVFVSEHVLHRNLEIRKCGVELGEPLDKALRPRPLVIRRVVVLHVWRNNLGQLLEVMAVDAFAHLLLCCNIRFFTHISHPSRLDAKHSETRC